MEEFVDSNGDGIPDAFENRLPISEILNLDPGPTEIYGTIIIEVEKRQRSPKKGEYFFWGSSNIKRADYDYALDGGHKFMVIKQIVAGTLDGYGEGGDE